MIISVNNDNIVIEDADKATEEVLRKKLSYVDKSKMYQLNRMKKNPFLRSSKAFAEIKKKAFGTLLSKDASGNLIVPTGILHVIENMGFEYTDNRHETGTIIALPWKTKPHDLRDYQQEAVDAMLSSWRGLVNLSTGLGKTLIAIYAIRAIKKKTLVVCPGKSIAGQFHKQLCDAFGEHRVGFIGDGKNKVRDITVGIAASVNNNLDKLQKECLGLIIIDETHHTPATTFYNIAQKLGNVGRIYGLTATDFRQDGKDLFITASVGEAIVRKDLAWGVRNGWLANPVIIVREIATTGKDYLDDKNKNYKQHVLKSETMNERIVADIKSMLAAGKRVLCLVDEVEHGRLLSAATGLPLATGEDKDSDLYVELLNRGKIQGLIGTDSKIGEGTDTRLVDTLILANFVASKGILWQCIGRGMRLYEGKKTCIILDYVPTGSEMLVRHAEQRMEYYEELTPNVKFISLNQ